MNKINEHTPFLKNGEPTGLSILDFWKYQFANIYDLQEHIAEFIVGKALEIKEPTNRNGWTLWDIEYKGMRIEVKETGYYHSWQEDNGKVCKQRTFSIQPAYTDYKDSNSELKRQNDIYVFCLNTGINKKESYPLELSNWEFYVVPTYIINKNCSPTQKSISLNKVRKLVRMTRYDQLKNTIDSICYK